MSTRGRRRAEAKRRGERSAKRSVAPVRRAPARRSFSSRCARFVHGHAVAFTAGVVALSLLFSWLAFQPTPHTGGDNAAYIALGRSLLERHAYLELYDPAQPPHTQYPPVFPGILAVAMAAGLAPWVPLKLIVVAFGAAAVGFSFLWIRRRGRPLLALGVAVLLGIAPGVLTENHWILSDAPFWCFTAAALWAFERLPPAARGRFLFGVAAVVIAYFTRSAGLPLAFAALGWLAWRRRWKHLAILAGVFFPLAFAWWLRARSLGGVDYVSQFLLVDPYSPALGHVGMADLVRRAAENAVNYVHIHLPRLLLGRMERWLDPPSLLLFALAAVGWARSMRRPGVAELFLPLYLGLLLAWPAVWSGERFLLPALPLLLFYSGDVVVRVATRLDRRAGLAAGAAVFALIIAAAVHALRLEVRYAAACREAYRAGDPYPCLPGEPWREFFAVAEAAPDALPDGAAVISRKPRLFYALSGLPGRIYPFTDDADTFFAFADTSRTRYLVFDGLGRPSQAYVRPVLVRRPGAFCAMFAAPGGTALFG
ncbi:MAG: ArnT family glycosyltransferase, partial [Longimicrobiales bacterium]